MMGARLYIIHHDEDIDDTIVGPLLDDRLKEKLLKP